MEPNGTGRVYLVGAGPGDPRLITLRGVECLQGADVVVHDRLVNRTLLAFAPQAEWIDVGKRPDHHPTPQEGINALLVEQAFSGKQVVRLKGGDPFVFGRGGEEAAALFQAGIPFEVVPGITSAIAGPAYAGIPVTHRGVACSAAVITGHRADSCADDDWRRLANSTDTLVFLMGVKNLSRIVAQLLAGGRLPETPVALIEQASCATQHTVVGCLADIVERGRAIKPPALIVVGDVVRLREQLNWFERPALRPLQGLRVLNTRPLAEREAPFRQARHQEAQTGDAPLFFNRPGCFDAFSLRLSSLGADVVELPATQIAALSDPAPLDAAIARLVSCSQAARHAAQPYDWIVFSSANGVVYFFQRFFELGYDARRLSCIRLAAVGQSTAQALRNESLWPDVIVHSLPSNDLSAMLPDLSGQRVLLPRADGDGSASTDSEFVVQLLALGALVEPVATYAVQPAEPEPEALRALMERQVDVAVFFSPAAVDGLVQQLAKCGLPPLFQLLHGSRVACIGPTTAQAAAAAGLAVDWMAQPHTLEGMVASLVARASELKRAPVKAV